MSERAKYMVEIARKQMRHAKVAENPGDILQNGNCSSKSVVSEVFQDDSFGGNRADDQETDRSIEEESAVLHTENCSSKSVVSKVFREYDTFGRVETQETEHAVEGEDDDMNIIYPSSTDELEVEDPYSSDDSLRDRNYVPDSSSSSDSEQSSESCQSSPVTIKTNKTVSNNEQTDDSSDNEWCDLDDDDVTDNFVPQKCQLLNIDKNGIKEPIDAFVCLITDEILDLIVEQTNIFATQKQAKQHSRKSRINKWTPTNRDEIKVFLGVTLAMGLTQVPHINLYWAKDDIYHNHFISSAISRDRYLLLLSFLHFENNETCDKANRLYKIQNIISKLLKNFQEALKPGNTLVIDESMIPFRGRLLFRQYIPNKSHKYGIKLYKLCSPEGYTFFVIVYSGKGETNAELGHSQSIVLKLLENVEPKEGKILFADNFYSSVPLVKQLLKKKMMYCGTLRANRKGLPVTFSAKSKIKRGQIISKKKGDVKIFKWMDKRQVLMISSVPSHKADLIPVGKKNKKGEDVVKPKCVIDYNAAKKGVDYSDQMSAYHTVLRRSLKWYRKVMFELILGTSVVNSLIIYNLCAKEKLSITEFRRQLAYSLVKSPNSEETIKVPKKRVHSFQKPDGPGRKKRKPCKGCRQILKQSGLNYREIDKKVRRVITYCSDCPGQPGFCLNCFNAAHN